jgi:ATP-dependent RNA helicase RhlE
LCALSYGFFSPSFPHESTIIIQKDVITLTFNECNLIDPIIQALTEQGYTEPTAIQAGAIPPALKGRDVLGCARTGTGKTCAFATPILQRLSKKTPDGHPIRALILTPTRELAIQNQECFEAYSKYLSLRSVVIFGGVGQRPQIQAIQKGADILVATPGRLADLYQQGYLDLSQLEIFVLDEADRMLDMGFIHDVKRILKWLPDKKQTLFFSATMPDEITALVNSLLHKPVLVAADPVNTAVDAIGQQVYKVDRQNKTKLLVELLNNQELSSVLVFTRTKHGANKVSKELQEAGITAAAIHGNKSQTARQEALASFKAGTLRVLVATDIAARGLDIEELSCVVNYNLPDVPETYVHRIGRTGRAGHSGTAIALCDYQELSLLKEIEKLMKKNIPVVENHSYPMENFEAVVRDKHGKVRNPEDEEARLAARERAKARKAAQKLKAEAASQPEEQKEAHDTKKRKKQAKPADGGSTAAQSSPAPEKTAKKGKKAKKKTAEVVAIPDLLPKPTQEPVQTERRFDSNDVLHRKYKRPEKKVIPSLSSVSLLPTVELKETFHSREEDLFSQHSEKLPARDATARMFSEKKSVPERYRPEKKTAGEAEEKQGNRRRKKPSKKKEAASVDAPLVKQEKQKGDKPKNHKLKSENQKHEKPKNDKSKQERQKQNGQKSAGKKSVKQQAEQKKKVGRGAPMRFEKPSRQKDSTEQKTLMKPYYLSDLKK